MDFEEDARWAQCSECGCDFLQKGPWQKKCFHCFRSSPEGAAWAQRKREEEQHFAQGRNRSRSYQEEQQRRYREQQERMQQEQDRMYREFFGQGQQRYQQAAPKGVGLDKAMLRKLLQLCHPDKHGNSELSNEVTRALLAMKDKLP